MGDSVLLQTFALAQLAGLGYSVKQVLNQLSISMYHIPKAVYMA